MELPTSHDYLRMSVEEFDTTKLLRHAAQQRDQRGFDKMLRAAPQASEGWLRLQRDAKKAPRLFVSEWEVPLDASVETMIALRDKVVA